MLKVKGIVPQSPTDCFIKAEEDNKHVAFTGSSGTPPKNNRTRKHPRADVSVRVQDRDPKLEDDGVHHSMAQDNNTPEVFLSCPMFESLVI